MELVLDRKPGAGRTPESLADIARVQEIWRTALAASGGPFLFGTFTIADAMFAPVDDAVPTYGVELAPDKPRVRRRRCYALPAMKMWYADAELEAASR